MNTYYGRMFCAVLYLNILGYLQAGNVQLEDVAAGRGQYATQSHGSGYTTAEKALDGDTDPSRRGRSCASAKHIPWSRTPPPRKEAWWMVDLGRQQAIYHVIIYGAESFYGDYYVGVADFSVRVSSSADIDKHTQSDQCALWNRDAFPDGSISMVLECDHVMYGRYVSIGKFPGLGGSLKLCEVMVMGRDLDTECSNCNDDTCTSDAPCAECKTGLRQPECIEACTGYYGVGCKVPCSEGCEDTCDVVTGTCNCKDWWHDDLCGTQSAEIDGPYVRSVTESTAVIQWKKISNVPDGLSDHYRYVIEYNERSNDYQELETKLNHDPSTGQYQQYTLTGLPFNTPHRVRVRAYRILGTEMGGNGDWTDYSLTDYTKFHTECTEPEKPRNMTLTREDNGNTITLTVTWEDPQSYPYPACNSQSGTDSFTYNIRYGLTSESFDNWRSRDLLGEISSPKMQTLPYLDPGDYIVRVTVTNWHGKTNYDEKATRMDTDCSQCADSQCTTEDPCRTCQPGFKRPDCRDACDFGYYGVNCEQQCTEGHICDGFSCKDWRVGNQCTVEIKPLSLPGDAPVVSSVGESSVVIKWKKIINVPDGLSDHYQYVVEYKEETSSDWIKWQTVSHDPSSDQHQEDTLTGLKFNTFYDVQVKSYRVKGAAREETGDTEDYSFKTKFRALPGPTWTPACQSAPTIIRIQPPACP